MTCPSIAARKKKRDTKTKTKNVCSYVLEAVKSSFELQIDQLNLQLWIELEQNQYLGGERVFLQKVPTLTMSVHRPQLVWITSEILDFFVEWHLQSKRGKD